MENGTMSTQKESVGLSLDTKMPANTTTFPPSAGCVKNSNGEKKCQAIEVTNICLSTAAVRD